MNSFEVQKNQKEELGCMPLSAIEERRIEWLWKDRIPKDSLTLIEGDGGAGKSTIISDICSRLSAGIRLPDDETDRYPLRILLLSEEDDPGSVLKPRYLVHKADMDLVLLGNKPVTLNKEGLREIRSLVLENGIDVVVIDPIVSYIGSKLDMNKANDVRSIMAPLVEMGKETGCTFIVVRHFNKCRDGLASHRGAGSVDFRNAARSTLQVRSDPRSGFNYLIPEKSNYAVRAKALPFKIHNGLTQWGEPCDLSAQEFQSDQSEGRLGEAKEFLKIELKDGPIRAKAIISNSKEAGIASRTLNRAKEALGIVSLKKADGWVWCEPDTKQDQ